MSDQPTRHPIGIEREQALFLYLGHKLLYDRKGSYKMALFRRYIGYFIPQKEQDRALNWLLGRMLLDGIDHKSGNYSFVLEDIKDISELPDVREKITPTVRGLGVLEEAAAAFDANRPLDHGHWRTRLAQCIFNRLARRRTA